MTKRSTYENLQRILKALIASIASILFVLSITGNYMVSILSGLAFLTIGMIKFRLSLVLLLISEGIIALSLAFKLAPIFIGILLLGLVLFGRRWACIATYCIIVALSLIGIPNVILYSILISLATMLEPVEILTVIFLSLITNSTLELMLKSGVMNSWIDVLQLEVMKENVAGLIVYLTNNQIALVIADLMLIAFMVSLLTHELKERMNFVKLSSMLSALGTCIFTSLGFLMGFTNLMPDMILGCISSGLLSLILSQMFILHKRFEILERASKIAHLLDGGNVEVPLEDVGDMEEIKEELYTSIVLPLQHKDIVKFYKVRPVKGILLYGPPGCGKTLLMRALARKLKVNFYHVKLSDVLSKWYGESERRISEIFALAKNTAPSIIFFDELDALGRSRELYVNDDVAPRILSVLLNEMDGLDPLEGVIVVGATNRPDILDPALLRPGRFDKLIYVPPPDEEARMKILAVHLKDMPLAKDVDLRELARMTEGFSGADLAMLVQETARKVAKEAVFSNSTREITMKDFIDVLSKMRPSIDRDLIKRYELFRERYERMFSARPGGIIPEDQEVANFIIKSEDY